MCFTVNCQMLYHVLAVSGVQKFSSAAACTARLRRSMNSCAAWLASRRAAAYMDGARFFSRRSSRAKHYSGNSCCRTLPDSGSGQCTVRRLNRFFWERLTIKLTPPTPLLLICVGFDVKKYPRRIFNLKPVFQAHRSSSGICSRPLQRMH